MAKFNGTQFIATIPGSPNKTISDSRELTVDYNVNPIDVSTKGSGGNKVVIGGQKSWSMQMTGVVDFVPGTNNVNVAELMTLAAARTPISILASTGTTGDTSFAGTPLITKVSFGTPMEDACEWTMELTGSGPLVTAVIA